MGRRVTGSRSHGHGAPAVVLTVVGARPQFVKMGPVTRALRKFHGIRETVVHTGQHHDPDLSAVFFRELDLPPPDLNLGVASGAHGDMTARMLMALEGLLMERRPDVVLVYGDTNSTLAGALAAAKLGIPIAHVEAGLRSFRRTMPEEINRVVTDRLSTVLFTPTRTATDNLAAEGIREAVFEVGDVMYDMTLHVAERATQASSIVRQLGLTTNRYAVATVHRAENTDDANRLDHILSFLREQADSHPVVLPLHPRTRWAIGQWDLSTDGLLVIGPLGYFDMTQLVMESALVLTDSGGLQKEAYFHRIPCVTMRDETEWLETIDAGWNRLWGSPSYKTPRRDITEYGDGRAAEIIAKRLAELVGLGINRVSV